MKMTTKSGKPVTEKMLDEWANSFESGEWPKGRTVILGRPSLAAEDVKPVTFKLPVSKITEIDERAAQCGETRSEFLRSIIDKELTEV
ncbi:MAG: hypothetical protein LBK67_00885 [Coriobacteriales bacterium]|jgi:hypothetical protein|nr:hypothetical protein [Coriobacteriales bacterium]